MFIFISILVYFLKPDKKLSLTRVTRYHPPTLVFNIFESTIRTCMLHTYTWTCFKAPVASLFNIVRANVYTQFRKKDLLGKKKDFL